MNNQPEQVAFRANGRQCVVSAPNGMSSALFHGALTVPYVLGKWRPWDATETQSGREPLHLIVDPVEVNVVSDNDEFDATWRRFCADERRRILVEAEASAKPPVNMWLGFENEPGTRVRVQVNVTGVDTLVITRLN